MRRKGDGVLRGNLDEKKKGQMSSVPPAIEKRVGLLFKRTERWLGIQSGSF